MLARIAVLSLALGCHHSGAGGRSGDTSPFGAVPASLAIVPGSGIVLHGTAARIETAPVPIASLPKIARGALFPGVNPSLEPVSVDLAGGLRMRANAGSVTPVPLAAPVAAYAPWGIVRHAAILADGSIELVQGNTHYRFANPAHYTLVTNGCFATAAPGTGAPTAIACFSKMPIVNTGPVELVQDGTIAGPISRVEWAALGAMPPQLVAGWEHAGGPRTDDAVLQLAGSWTNAGGGGGWRGALVCGVLVDRTVSCWGTSHDGELADGRRVDAFRYVAIAGLTDVDELAVGPSFACARTRDHHVACWGDAGNGIYPMPRHPTHAMPGCKVDDAATERQYQARLARAKADAEACAQRTCAPGTLDCHLGCVVNDLPRTPVYATSGACTTSHVLTGVEVLDVDDAISIAAGNAELCIVHAAGYTTCGG